MVETDQASRMESDKVFLQLLPREDGSSVECSASHAFGRSKDDWCTGYLGYPF